MKTDKRIWIAFLLNLGFSIFECFGGMLTGSVAILSDAVHDMGDAAGIGVSYLLEKKSKKNPDAAHTYGYARYSVMGGMIATLLLLFGCLWVMGNGIRRIIHPTPIHYDGMIGIAVIGVVVNLFAALFTRKGGSLNLKAVNLHMLEDVLGWLIVLIGGVLMRLTDWTLIDPILSMGVSGFMLVQSILTLKQGMDLFLEKTPKGVGVAQVKETLLALDGVEDVHHLHVWSMDGQNHYATLHLVVGDDATCVKEQVREALRTFGIVHATLETEQQGEPCCSPKCEKLIHDGCGHHHHHH